MAAFSRWWRDTSNEFFPQNKYKLIFNLGKGTIQGNANYASTRKYNCRDILGIRVIWYYQLS